MQQYFKGKKWKRSYKNYITNNSITGLLVHYLSIQVEDDLKNAMPFAAYTKYTLEYLNQNLNTKIKTKAKMLDIVTDNNLNWESHSQCNMFSTNSKHRNMKMVCFLL